METDGQYPHFNLAGNDFRDSALILVTQYELLASIHFLKALKIEQPKSLKYIMDLGGGRWTKQPG